MRIISTFLLLFLPVVIFSSCSSENKPADDAAEKIPAEQPLEYQATGKVISIPPGNRNIIIKHGKIPGFMDAMTMPFALKDSLQLVGITAKDSVRFKINNAGNRVFISNIEKIK